MIRGALVLLAAFGLSSGLAILIQGCDFSDCNCTPTPALPQAQAPLPGLEIKSYDSSGNDVVIPVQPQNGTIEVTGNSVAISYQQAGVTHRVVYDVVGPR
jgi:hypothetical protein